jgi:nucleotide-binding universal stress UspA family protein
MYQRILVPLDSSSTAQRGFEEALRLARLCDASLVLLHVVEIFPMVADVASAAVWDQAITAQRENAQRMLERAHEAARSAGIAAETRLEDAAAARVCDVIVDQARDRRCDLIVMGTHGRRGIQRVFIGSDAERVLRMSTVPVLLVRTPAKQ